ncbi:MAG: hypothetical protein JXA54_04080 [Candidatus Heimdallarchaeota archaeon]|nr:hypothetical protein [Candidatus Heimdallarchaeota archaeon]
MKEKIITLTEKLYAAGFIIEGIDVEASDIIKIRFSGLAGLEVIINDSYAKIIEGDCSAKALAKLKKLLRANYVLKNEIESIDNDMFNKLLNAS